MQEGGYVKDGPKETNPVTLREAKWRGDVQQRWAEPAVWTERMLDALERGVKGGKHLLHNSWAVRPGTGPQANRPVLSEVRPPTGEPYAGDLHVRFGGRGGRATGSPYPYHTRSPSPAHLQHTIETVVVACTYAFPRRTVGTRQENHATVRPADRYVRILRLAGAAGQSMAASRR